MKVLLTGANGQIGRALRGCAPPGVQVHGKGHSDLDITDARAVAEVIAEVAPDVIVNAAAYTAVDRAEAEPEPAKHANAIGPANLARAAAAKGSRLIHLSTDFVFDGNSSRPYLPHDRTNPICVYGATKLAGESAVRDTLPGRSVILRTAWVYDAVGRNFLMTMLRLMRERGTVRVVADQIGTPTAASSIATAIWATVARSSLTGVYHWTDAGVASWYDFAVAIAEEWAAVSQSAAPATVIPIASSDYPTPAKRPAFSVLDKRATCADLELVPSHWRQNLRRVIGDIANPQGASLT
jgi:dTDP-4-dehydrorhamnose reductase